MFNSKFAGLVVAGFLMGAGVAQAFPGSVDESGIRLPARSTYAEMYRGMPGQSVGAFPSSSDETGIFLVGQSTYAAMHRGMADQAVSAFPTSSDEAGIRLPARNTRAGNTESLRAGVLPSTRAE